MILVGLIVCGPVMCYSVLIYTVFLDGDTQSVSLVALSQVIGEIHCAGRITKWSARTFGSMVNRSHF